MNNWNAIFETLNEALERKNTDITVLEFRLENAQKAAEEAEAKYKELEAKYKEVQEATYAHLKVKEEQHKEEVKLLEARIIHLEGKLNPSRSAAEKEKENGNQ